MGRSPCDAPLFEGRGRACWLTLLVLILIPMVSIAARAGAQRLVSDPSSLTLSPGDVIRIEVWQQKEYNCECAIAADGSLVHPLYREIKVAGLPLSEVESRIRSFLSRYLSSPTFEIQPLLRVIVAGEVRQPNIYTVPPGTTVAQVIAMAGGPTDRGRLEAVKVIRPIGSQVLDLTRPDAATSRTEVHSGDQILVARRRNIMQDIVAPSSSIVGALAAVTGVIIQLRR
jgi:polysaccharide export outer membrane protein